MQQKLIISDPAIMMGKPIVAGTRITVELILEKLGAGETTEQLLEAHPRLTREAVWQHWHLRQMPYEPMCYIQLLRYRIANFG